MPVSVAHELAALLPNAEIAVLPGAGHMPFWEAPDRFSIVTDAMARQAPEGLLGIHLNLLMVPRDPNNDVGRSSHGLFTKPTTGEEAA